MHDHVTGYGSGPAATHHIRRALPSEAEALGRIAFAAKASWGYSLPQLHAWSEALRPTAESIREQPTFVAEIDGHLVGFCQLNVTARPAELDHLWVAPESMRRGVGRALLTHALRYLAASGVAELHIDSDPNAERFYLAQGAVRIAAQPAPIEGRPDRVRPQLRLAT